MQTSSGLSPRVRGNLRLEYQPIGAGRSIPACTGEPLGRADRPGCGRVYPRVYGGTGLVMIAVGPFPGLSPRVRGNQHQCAGPGGRCGSIPACTGEPRSLPRSRRASAVYPRVYGGTRNVRTWPAIVAGLSPRVRGNLLHVGHERLVRGSIPACTGEPQGRGGGQHNAKVYPRVYGGTIAVSLRWPLAAGLSPRVRGNLVAPGDRGRVHGSIPACTGEPRSWIRTSMPVTVYPRVYGGTQRKGAGIKAPTGLSPRVRGNRLRAGRDRGGRRSIPACTGEPVGVADQPHRPRVYPRVYGGTRICAGPYTTPGGLSPRVRGNQVKPIRHKIRDRSIPACTGEPVVCGRRRA